MEEVLRPLEKENRRNAPRVFAALGEFIKRAKWLGYLSAILVVCGSIFFLFLYYKHISESGLFQYFNFVGWWIFLSVGFVKFAETYGTSIAEGRKSAIGGLVVMLSLFAAFAGFIALVEYADVAGIYWIFISIFAAALGLIVLLLAGLLFYWKALLSGIDVYDE